VKVLIKDTEALNIRLDLKEYAKNGQLSSLMNIQLLLRADQLKALTLISVEILMEQEKLFGVTRVILKRDGSIVMKSRKEALKVFGEWKLQITQAHKWRLDLDSHVKVGNNKLLTNILGHQLISQMLILKLITAEIQDKAETQFGALQLIQSKNGNIVIQSLRILLQLHHSYQVKKVWQVLIMTWCIEALNPKQ